MTVGEKIKYYRNIRGISQEMLGNLSGITENPEIEINGERKVKLPKSDDRTKIKVMGTDGFLYNKTNVARSSRRRTSSTPLT